MLLSVLGDSPRCHTGSVPFRDCRNFFKILNYSSHMQEIPHTESLTKGIAAVDSFPENEVLIRVDNISKRFCRDLKKSLLYGAKDIISDLVARDRSRLPLRDDEFWANEKISFEVKRGECLGLIGHNGAGKTTLLRMLNGLIKPDQGQIEMRGRVGALIALGAGFNPILSGRENVFIGGAVLGLSKKEILAQYDSIVEFSELGDFMETPVQYYSSGMQVRLGFAIASSLDPDILLLDEVLAVGDRAFRIKCMDRIASLLNRCAVIYVSHQMAQVSRICSRVLVLNQGRQGYLGETLAGISVYQTHGAGNKREPEFFGDAGCSCLCFKLEKDKIGFNENLDFILKFRANRSIDSVVLRVHIVDQSDSLLMEWNSENHVGLMDISVGDNCISEKIENIKLRHGRYYLSFAITPKGSAEYLLVGAFCAMFEVTEGVFGTCDIQI